ncbi:hypothetical protein [Rhizobium leguminosarum]|uniref:hypothetical protein n=1 Tax=Rhizobium leguminosarum TaxID=384 RepID=UPI001C94CD68|nr:hypothetical protein [Rhizobium leguminosarum]MBY5579272.1 hypothetical protein [Rhizobium leguminosarum]MBY5664723.1 hypothetical protein [Rhizobium leguminosarum]MBY5678454.1 hypothetical protein [Rhizobium leguminosarum]MBY5756942.1 hypothetical protein [Rhizobium leguminosarum]
MINPAFLHRKDELALIGEMVIGYGELDISFAMICGIALNHQWAVLDACQQVRSETSRLDIAAALGKEAFEQMNLKNEFEISLRQLKHCVKIRNQYAHSQWGDLEGSLKFLNPETAFERPLKQASWKIVDLKLLQQQEAFFENTRAWVLWLEFALRSRELRRPLDLNRPPERELPNLHSPLPTPGRIPKGKGSREQPQ